MKIEIHHHYHGGATVDELRAIHLALVNMKEILVTTAEQFNQGFERLNKATTAVADLIRKLVEQQQTGDMTPEEEAAAHSKLLAAADALEAMAATPTDPVPTDPPTVED